MAADLRIRASVEDGAKARADLEALGTAGTRSLTQIQQASGAAAQQLQGLQAATARVAQAGAGLDVAKAGLVATGDAAVDATAAVRALGGQVLASGGNLQALAQAAAGFLSTVGGPLGAAAGAAIGVLSSQFLMARQNAETFGSAISTHQALFSEATQAAARYRVGLSDSARELNSLTDAYRNSSEAVRVFEERRQSASRAGLRTQGNNLVEQSLGSLRSDVASARGSTPATDIPGNFLGTATEGTRRLSGGLEQVRQALQEFDRSTDSTQERVAALVNRLTSAAETAENFRSSIQASAQSLAAALPQLVQLEEAQKQAAAQFLALRIGAGDSTEAINRYAASFGNLSGEVLRAANAINALAQGSVGRAEDRIANEIARNRAIIEATRTGGREAGLAVQGGFTRQDAILGRASDLEASRIRELQATGQSAEQAREAVRELRTEFVAQATAAVDGGRTASAGLERQARAARETTEDMRELFDVVRRDASTGLLSLGALDDRAIREVAQQTAELRRERERAAQEARRTAERAEQEADRFAGRWGDRLADATTQGLYDGFTKGGDIFTTLTRTFGNLLRQAVSAALSQHVFTPLVSNLVGGSGAAGASGGGITGSLGSLGNLSSLGNTAGGYLVSGVQYLGNGANSLTSSLGLGNIFGGGPGLGNATATYGEGIGSFAAGGVRDVAGNAAGLSGVTLGSIGSYLGAGAAGVGVGSALNRAAGGTQLGGTIGGTIGAIGGSIIGGPIGGFIGGTLGSLVGGLFGPKTQFRGGDVMYGINASGELDAIGAFGKRWDAAGATAEVRQQLAPINQQLRNFGIRLDTSQNGALGYQIGNVGFGQSKNDAATSERAIVEAIQRLGRSDNANIQTILARPRSDGEKTIQSVLDDAGFVKGTYEELLKNFSTSMSEFRRSFDALERPFADAINNAKRLGLATDELTAARQREIDRLVEGRNATLNGFWTNFDVRSRRASGADAQTTDLIEFDAAAANELRNLKEQLRQLGTTAGETAAFVTGLENTQAAERLAIQKSYTEQAVALEKQRVEALLQQGQGIRDFIDAQNATGASGAAPVDQLASARDVYARDLQLARGNDADALGRITGQAQNLLSAAGSVYASGGEFQSIRRNVLSDLSSLPATLGQDASLAAQLGQPNDDLTRALAAQIPGQASVASAFGGIAEMVQRQDAALASHIRMEGISNRMLERLGSGFDGLIGRADTMIRRLESLLDETKGARSEARMARVAAVASGLPDYGANTA